VSGADIEARTWERLMSMVTGVEVAEVADYTPGHGVPPGGVPAGPHAPPGSGTEGADPLGLQWVNRGHLGLVLTEAFESAVTRGGQQPGSDREALIQVILDAVGEGEEQFTAADVEDALDGTVQCPDPKLLAAFASTLAIDESILIDAGQRNGCGQYGIPSPGVGV
jgi:hypothetical protein